MSVSNYAENVALDALTMTYCKVHIGDPGEAGTSNAAGNTTRAAITMGAASSGTRTASALPAWPSVSTSETYSHVSLWDHATAGNCIWTGAMAASVAVTAGDNFDLTALTVSLD